MTPTEARQPLVRALNTILCRWTGRASVPLFTEECVAFAEECGYSALVAENAALKEQLDNSTAVNNHLLSGDLKASVNEIELLRERVKTLRDALLAYVCVCGSTARMVDRVGLGQAYQMETAALDGTKEPI